RDHLVRRMLELLHLRLRRTRGPEQEPLLDRAGDLDDALPRLGEQRVDLPRARPETEPHENTAFTGHQISAATSAAAGIVSTHAINMLPAIPHRTADSRLVAPEPITDPDTTWVVESG